MVARIRRLLNQLFRRTSTINHEPLNRVSLIVIVLLDIFILVNVFAGLNDIGSWYLAPSEAYPCQAQWQNYRTRTAPNKDYDIVAQTLSDSRILPVRPVQQRYQETAQDRLGSVSPVCLQYAGYQDQLNTPALQNIAKSLDRHQRDISTLEASNRRIRSEYGSSLLEKIAGQPQDQSINAVSAEKAKQTLEQNNRKIADFKKEITQLQQQLIAQPESVNFLTFLKQEEPFNQVDRGYQQAAFWYPTLQLALQALFLLPLVAIALLLQKLAQRRGYGLVSLISWHLLVIFMIPLIIKVFEFLQVGVLFNFLFNVVKVIFGGLLFVVSYLYILIIPLVGFGIIKFFQNVVFNRKLQAANRVQKGRCVHCARKLRSTDHYCPHCGTDQYDACTHCGESTYRDLPYCKHCGHSHP